MSKPRLNRLFNARSGRAFDVAVDHGAFHEPSFLTGIEDMARRPSPPRRRRPRRRSAHARPGPAAAVRPGQAEAGLVLRTDIANVYNDPLESPLHSIHVPDAIEVAVRLDAVAVCVNLLDLPASRRCASSASDRFLALRTDAEKYGMPLMIEPSSCRPSPASGGYGVDGDTAKVVHLVRQARELGADLIKADPTDDIGDYHASSSRGDTRCSFAGGRTRRRPHAPGAHPAVLEQGARGIVYGRNVIQHRDPAGITAALMVGRARESVGRRGPRPDRRCGMIRARGRGTPQVLADAPTTTPPPAKETSMTGKEDRRRHHRRRPSMGREIAAALRRWPALIDHPAEPELVAVCTTSTRRRSGYLRAHRHGAADHDRSPRASRRSARRRRPSRAPRSA